MATKPQGTNEEDLRRQIAHLHGYGDGEWENSNVANRLIEQTLGLLYQQTIQARIEELKSEQMTNYEAKRSRRISELEGELNHG